ncbi:hypothetical protein ABN226_18630, partial [Morganella morganii]|uniref:hypothetical protein n=1 Tax=Morganella morganii TaxID=582 RepID=UPI0032DAAE91
IKFRLDKCKGYTAEAKSFSSVGFKNDKHTFPIMQLLGIRLPFYWGLKADPTGGNDVHILATNSNHTPKPLY